MTHIDRGATRAEPPRAARSLARWGRWHGALFGLSLGATSPVAGAQNAASEPRSIEARAVEGGDPGGPAPETEGTDVRPPQPKEPFEVIYPPDGRGDTVVVLRLLVSEDGAVTEARAIEGDEPFRSAAEAAALEFRFTPALVGGTPKAAYVLYRVEFLEPRVDDPNPPGDTAPNESAPMAEQRGEAEPQSPETVDAPIEIQVGGRRSAPGARVFSDAQTRIVPGAEGDPVRYVEAMPGTVTYVTGAPFMALRGGSPGKTGYEFDGIRLPYLFHLARGPAVVHPWLVDSATVYGAGYPASIGNATGGVIVASAAEPLYEARAQGRVRLTDSEAGVEAPFGDGRGSVMVAGRYSYTKPLVSLVAPDYRLDFWDYQARAQYDLSSRDQIQVIAFGAGDTSQQTLEDGTIDDLFNASFHRVALRYVRQTGDDQVTRVTAFGGIDRWADHENPKPPRMTVIGARAETELNLERSTRLSYGAHVDLAFVDGSRDWDLEDTRLDLESRVRTDSNVGVFGALTWQPTRRFTITPGLRLDAYHSEATPRNLGGTYLSPEPRLALSLEASPSVRLHQAIGLAAQPPSRTFRPPGAQDPVTGGLEQALSSDFGVEFSVAEKLRFDLAAFHTAFFDTGDIRTLAELQDQAFDRRGNGQAYGLEALVARSLGRDLQGFVAYTLLFSNRSLGRVSGPAEMDRRHTLDVVLAYDFGKGYRVASRATYYTGFPARMRTVAQAAAPRRAPDYWQLDWQFDKTWRVGNDGAYWGVTAGVLNTTFNLETNDVDCTQAGSCIEEAVGPVSVPTFGVTGAL